MDQQELKDWSDQLTMEMNRVANDLREAQERLNLEQERFTTICRRVEFVSNLLEPRLPAGG